jgi:hypothetical protein
MKILFTAHPKSGTTWLCRILDCLLADSYTRTAFNQSVDIKRIYESADSTITFSFLGNPVHSDELYVPDHDKCIILYRDYKDILVSSYFHQKYRSGIPFEGDISDFIDSDRGGIRGIIKLYRLIEKEGKNKEYLHYETMEESIKQLSLFRNMNIDTCLEANTFERMRQLEISNFKNKKKIHPAEARELGPVKLSNINSYKTRNGKINDHVNHLSQADIDKIDRIIKDLKNEYYSSK